MRRVLFPLFQKYGVGGFYTPFPTHYGGHCSLLRVRIIGYSRKINHFRAGRAIIGYLRISFIFYSDMRPIIAILMRR